jgi:hypothetical protein
VALIQMGIARHAVGGAIAFPFWWGWVQKTRPRIILYAGETVQAGLQTCSTGRYTAIGIAGGFVCLLSRHAGPIPALECVALIDMRVPGQAVGGDGAVRGMGIRLEGYEQEDRETEDRKVSGFHD